MLIQYKAFILYQCECYTSIMKTTSYPHPYSHTSRLPLPPPPQHTHTRARAHTRNENDNLGQSIVQNAVYLPSYLHAFIAYLLSYLHVVFISYLLFCPLPALPSSSQELWACPYT